MQISPRPQIGYKILATYVFNWEFFILLVYIYIYIYIYSFLCSCFFNERVKNVLLLRELVILMLLAWNRLATYIFYFISMQSVSRIYVFFFISLQESMYCHILIETLFQLLTFLLLDQLLT